MTEEEKEAIENLEDEVYSIEGIEIQKITFYTKGVEDIKTILNLIQKQQKENEKLKNKNQDLLRKLRNRVKEVNKLNKYSLYKTEFSNLNKQIEEKDRIIDLMATRVYLNEQEREEMKEYIYTSNKPKNFKSFVKQYFEKQAKEV